MMTSILKQAILHCTALAGTFPKSMIPRLGGRACFVLNLSTTARLWRSSMSLSKLNRIWQRCYPAEPEIGGTFDIRVQPEKQCSSVSHCYCSPVEGRTTCASCHNPQDIVTLKNVPLRDVNWIRHTLNDAPLINLSNRFRRMVSFKLRPPFPGK